MVKEMAKHVPLVALPDDRYINEEDLSLDWRGLGHIVFGSLLVILFVVGVALAASGS